MINKVFLILLLCSSVLSYSQEKIKGNKIVTIIDTQVDAFNKVSIGEKFEVFLVKSFEPSVEIETDENLHEVIQFNVENKTLTFRTTHKITSRKKLIIRVKYAEPIIGLETKEDAELSAVSLIESDSLTLKTYGNSKVSFNLKSKSFHLIHGEKSKATLNIESQHVNLNLNESSKVEALIASDSLKVMMYKNTTASIEGDASHLELLAEKSSHFKGKNLSLKTSHIIAKDNTDANIQISESITIEASENAQINLYGDPKITIDKFVNSAKLHKKEL